MSIIDYCGWRMIACCKLPIKQDTLCYGSAGLFLFPTSFFLLLFPLLSRTWRRSLLRVLHLPSCCVEDGGRTVHDKDSILSKLMKTAAQQINIKGHIVGPNPEKHVMLYAPTDIEGHRATDGRYYVVGTIILSSACNR